MTPQARHQTPLADLQPVSSPQIEAVLGQLGHASACARSARRVAWDFAVEIDSLLAEGLTKSDLRWLVSSGYIEHAEETTRPRDAVRNFRPGHNLAFSRHTCFVLTEAGVQLAASLCPRPRIVPESRSAALLAAPPAATANVSHTPSWDRQHRILRVGTCVVKHYRVPSPAQEAILAAFEEEGWPAAIDDPLPPHPEQDPKRRLRTTIQSLNANQRNSLLHFRGDGTGERVLWEIVEQPAMHVPARVRKLAGAA